MTWLFALGRLVRRPLQARRRPTSRPGRPRARLRLEALEDRALPSTVTWTNAAGGAWENAANWSGGALPGPADDVQINTLNAGATVTHASDPTSIHSLTVSTANGTLAVTGGSLALAAASSINDTLSLSNNGTTITGAGNLTLNGPFNWTGGTMSGAGTTTLSGASALSGSDWKWLVGRTLNNAGALTWTGAGFIHGVDGAVINNQSGATFAAQTDSEFCVGGAATAVFNNLAGATFRKTVATGTTVNLWVLNNSGTVDLQSGALSNYAGGTDGGAFTVAAPATLAFNGGYHNLAAGSSVAGAGAVVFSAGVTDVAGTYNVTGSTAVNSYNAVANFEGTTTSVGASLSISAGTANFVTNVAVATLNLSGGTLTGPGTVTVNTALNWSAGTMSDAGTTNVAALATLSINSNNGPTLDGRTLNNAGTATWSGVNYFYAGDGAVFNNQATATFTAQSDEPFSWYTGDSPVFNNAGTFTKSTGTGTTTMSGLFNNSGTVNVTSGTLSLAGGGSDTGAFATVSGATLAFSGGYHSLAAGSSAAGAGTVSFTGGVTDFGGTYNVTGRTTVSGGTVNFEGTVTSLGSSLTVTGGTADFVSGAAVDTLTLSGGTLTGPGAVTVNTALNWAGGAMSDAGSTNVAAGATLAINGTVFLDGRTLNNAGTATWSAFIYAYDGAVVNNQAGATFTVQSDQTFYWYTGDSPTFNNAGTFTKAAGTGTTTMQGLFNNSGTVNVNSGTLSLAGGGSDTGAFAVAAGKTLNFNGGYHNFAPGSSVAGAGGVVFSGGVTDVAGTYNVTGSTAVSGGTANLAGPITSLGTSLTVTSGTSTINFFNSAVSVGTLTMSGGTLLGTADVAVTGALNWTGGYMADVGSTSVAAAATLTINGYVFLDGRTLNNAGAATWAATAGTFYAYDGAVVNNQAGATFTVQSDQLFYWYTGDTPVFNNAGTFTKAGGPGATTMQGLFNNSGTVNVNSGTLALAGGGSDTGAFAVASGKTLNFNGGYDSLAPASSVAGAGNVSFSGGVTDVAGTYNVTGTTAVSGGTANFYGNATANTLNLSSGTLGGTGSVTVNTALNWTGGYMADVGSTSVAAAATLTINGTVYLDGRTLNNAGAATWAATAGSIYAGDGAVVNNQAGATFTVQNDQAFYWYTGTSPVFNNAGTFTKAAGSGTTTMQGLFNNSGTANINSGTLALYGGGSDTGAFAVASGKTLNFNGGSHNLTAASGVSGAGTVTISNGTVDIRGTYNVTGSTTVSGGTADFLSNASTGAFSNSGTVTIASGTALTVSGNYTQTSGYTYLYAGTLAAANVNLNGGYFYGLGAVNLGSGTFTNAGILSLGIGGSTGILTITGNYTQTSAGQLYVKIGGNTAGTQYDRLAVSGTATLNGYLGVSDINSFVPASGSTFQVLTCGSRSGTFSSTGIDGHFKTPPTYNATDVTLVAN